MPDTPPTVACHQCRFRQPADGPQCTKCGAPFLRICVCGEQVHMAAGTCASCGRAVVFRAVRRRLGRKLVAVGLLGAVAATGFIVWRRQSGDGESPVWKIRDNGVRAYDAKQYSAAIEAFRELTARAPRDAEGWYMLAASLKASGMARDAWGPAAEKSVEISPGLVPARVLLAGEEVQARNGVAAEPHLRKALEANPGESSLWLMLGSALLTRPVPDIAGAEAAISKARDLGADDVRTKVLLARLRLMLHGWVASDAQPAPLSTALREAATALERATSADLDPVEIEASRAEIRLATGDGRAAAVAAGSILQRDASQVTSDTRARMHLVMARVAADERDSAGAGAAVLAAIDASGTPQVVTEGVSLLVSNGLNDVAVSALERASSAPGADPTIKLLLAQVLLRRGDTTRTRTLADELAASRADELSVTLLRGDIESAASRWDDAIAQYEAAATRFPARPEPLTRIVIAELQRGAGGAASKGGMPALLGRIDAAITSMGPLADLLAARAHVLLATGSVFAARQSAERATAANPADPRAWRLLAEARVQEGDPDSLRAAAGALRRARLLDPGDPALPLVEADLLLIGGDSAGAVAICSEYLRSSPGDPRALGIRVRASRSLGLWAAVADDIRTLRRAADASESLTVDLVEAEYKAGRRDAARAVIAEVKPKASPTLAAQLEATRAIHEEGGVDAATARLTGASGRALAASLFLSVGRLDDAIRTAREVLQQAPGEPTATGALVLALLDSDAPLAGRTAEARKALSTLSADAAPGSRELLEGRILLVEGNAREALPLFEAAVAARRSDPLALLSLGSALGEVGEDDRAIQVLRAATFVGGGDSRFPALVARQMCRIAARSTDLQQRERIASEAARLNPASADAAILSADSASVRGDYRRAAEVIEQALGGYGAADTPDSRRLRWLAAVARLNQGDTAAAMSHLAALPPGADAQGGVETLRGLALLRSGDAAAALTELDKVIAAHPENGLAVVGAAVARILRGEPAAAVALGRAWLGRGSGTSVPSAIVGHLRRANCLPDATLLAREISDRAPSDRPAGVAYAGLLALAGREAEAVEAVRAWGRRADTQAATQSALDVGRALNLWARDPQGGLAAARDLQRRPDALPDEVVEARVLEAECLLALGREPEASASIRSLRGRWTGSRPTEPVDQRLESRVRFVSGSCAARTGELARATEEFRRCFEIDPENWSALNNYAWCAARSGGDLAGALTAARKTTQAQPGNGEFWDTLGDVATRAGETGEATAALKRAVQEFQRAGAGDALSRSALRLASLLVAAGDRAGATEMARICLGATRDTATQAEARKLLAEAEQEIR